jgi:hypothetical protein
MGAGMTCEEQIAKWVKGESVHNDERDECCPDFSCCRPDLLADKETRLRFQRAQQEGRDGLVHGMLMMFLSALVAEKKVYVAGFEHGD